MSSPALNLVIDARPRGPRGPLALEIVLGRSVLNHLLEQAIALGATEQPIAICAREDEHNLLRQMVADPSPARIVFMTGPPQAAAAILRTDRFYDARRLRRALARGKNTETAVIWRLDRPELLLAAEEELTHRLTYQPLGRFWAFSLAERLAAALQATWVRPHVVTVSAAIFLLTAAGIVAFGGLGWPQQIVTALALALALVLDTADGRLARLQGTSSAFGRWLDQVLDELADITLHGAIAWATFQTSHQPFWLVAGMLYLSGKYLFLFQSIAGMALEEKSKRQGEAPAESGASAPRQSSRPSRSIDLPRSLRRLVEAAGHADLRWHLWIVLALVGRLDLALVGYAAYFPLRALAGGLRKAVAHG
jgi:phosphatidylglycerophosphate synthase